MLMEIETHLSLSGITTGPAYPASREGRRPKGGGGSKIGFTCGTFFANLAKVLAKICVCARNLPRHFLDFLPWLWNFARIQCLNRYFGQKGSAKPNVSPLLSCTMFFVT